MCVSTDLQLFQFELDVSWRPHAFGVHYWQGRTHLDRLTQVSAAQ